MIARHVQPHVADGLDAFRSVLLQGPRQSGKTTLVRALAEQRGGTYLSLEDPETLEDVLADTRHVLVSASAPVVVDEVQLGGDRLVRVIKDILDSSNAPGQFLLTGSTNFLSVCNIRESLAGRVAIYELWPLSQAELSGAPRPRMGRLFGHPPGAATHAPGKAGYMEMVCRGGYPEMTRLDEQRRRAVWASSYWSTVIERDVRAVSSFRSIGALDKLVKWAAAMSSQSLNVSSASSDLQITRPTLNAALNWMHTLGLAWCLQPWGGNYIARATKTPKLMVGDTGIAAGMLNLSPESLLRPGAEMAGAMLETFVANELRRQASAGPDPVSVFFMRDRNGKLEADFVLERADGAVVALEVKATHSPSRDDAKHLRWLRDRMDRSSPGKFCNGLLLHCGEKTVEIGDRLHMAPISTLWAAPPISQQIALPVS